VVAREWLLAIPDRLHQCAKRWRLEIGECLGIGGTSRAFGCVDDQGRSLVLKLAPPEMRADLEAGALTLWAGRGSVRPVDFAHDIGGLLLERRIVPFRGRPPSIRREVQPPDDTVDTVHRVVQSCLL